MLYNPHWKTKPFTLAHFIAWLETKPPQRMYNFNNCNGKCLAGQYMTAHGREWSVETYLQTCEELFGRTWECSVLIDLPQTFGDALKRARAI